MDGKGKKHPLPDAVRYWDFLGGCYWLSDAEMMADMAAAAGLIKSAWYYEGEEWVWNFTVPEGAETTVTLPGESGSQTYGSGSYEIRKSL